MHIFNQIKVFCKKWLLKSYIAVVRNVLKKHETTALSMNMMQLQIKDYYPETDESEDEIDVTAVKVTNLPPKISKEQIELFFENIKRSGSEEFKKVDYDEAANCAIVWFNDSKGKLEEHCRYCKINVIYSYIFLKKRSDYSRLGFSVQ